MEHYENMKKKEMKIVEQLLPSYSRSLDAVNYTLCILRILYQLFCLSLLTENITLDGIFYSYIDRKAVTLVSVTSTKNCTRFGL